MNMFQTEAGAEGLQDLLRDKKCDNCDEFVGE